jgi:acyl dehydratase
MSIDRDYLLGLTPIESEHRYTVRDTILYALGLGVGLSEGLADADARFLRRDGLQALPTMAAILAYPGFWSRDPKYRISWKEILHVGHSVELHAPLAVEGHVAGETRIDDVFDRGPGKGALMHISRRIYDLGTGTHLATVRQVNLLRGDGGFEGPLPPAKVTYPSPARAPDAIVLLPTSRNQAHIYSLLGDDNPLHTDANAAQSAGFSGPILHGLSTFGMVGRAALLALSNNDPLRLVHLDASFSNPVTPGETLEVRLWHLPDGNGALEARTLESDAVVLRNGHVQLRS